ncbi:E3 ubiquitin-protein ligase COP1 [Spatholobus suberectus]|nr:E3 ubiquitin-protein ligase COP1 [Spatholobus suberectus]
MSQLGVALQDSLRTQREPRTILGLLREQMDGVDGGTRRRRGFKERFGFIGMGCCGATWRFRSDTLSVTQGEREREREQEQEQPPQRETDPGPECVGPGPAGSGMNLAAALAAERQLRGPQEEAVRAPGTPWRVSLMRLLEEAEGGDAAEKEENGGGGGGVVGNDSVCCVCMGRKKGAAFIPCGHTFCRVCSRELWLNRGSCPLCNRSILEILDIF